jgi:hypothetical protein
VQMYFKKKKKNNNNNKKIKKKIISQLSYSTILCTILFETILMNIILADYLFFQIFQSFILLYNIEFNCLQIK